MSRLWTTGEAAAYSGIHGASRLGTNSAAEYLVCEKITGENAANHTLKCLNTCFSTQVEQVTEEEKWILDGIFRGKVDDKTYVFRTKTSLVDGLRETRELKLQTWKYVDDNAPVERKY